MRSIRWHLIALVAAALFVRCDGNSALPFSVRFSVAPRAGEIVSQTWQSFTVQFVDALDTGTDMDGRNVTITLVEGTGTLGGTLTQALSGSEAAFDDLSYDVRETITIRATLSGTPLAVEAQLVISGTPDHLAFGYAPATLAQVDTVFSFFTVEVRDDADVRVYADSGTMVTLSEDGSGDFGGTNPVATADGHAVFSDITYDTEDEFDITASATDLTSAMFSSVDVVDGPSDGDSIARASVVSGGAQSSGGSSVEPVTSGNGRFVSFESHATNLVPGDTNDSLDVFLHDRVLNTTEIISTSSTEVIANDRSCYPAISSDGRYVAFNSAATNLAPSLATGGEENLYVRDRKLGTTTLVSLTVDGEPAGGGSDYPEISSDGRFIVYHSAAAGLAEGDTNGNHDIFVYDQLTGTTDWASVTSDEGGSAGTGSFQGAVIPAISDDGMIVAFTADYSDLVAGDTNGQRDVFVRDRAAGTTVRASVSSTGEEGNNRSENVHLSGDGRYVTFDSRATNLVPGDTNGLADVFVRDLQTNTTIRISVNSDEEQAVGGISDYPAFSKDGRFITFRSGADNLVSETTNGILHIFVRDLMSGETALVSVDSGGSPGTGGLCGLPYISHDGRFISFQSTMPNLVGGDSNSLQDIFVAPNPFLAP